MPFAGKKSPGTKPNYTPTCTKLDSTAHTKAVVALPMPSRDNMVASSSRVVYEISTFEGNKRLAGTMELRVVAKARVEREVVEVWKG